VPIPPLYLIIPVFSRDFTYEDTAKAIRRLSGIAKMKIDLMRNGYLGACRITRVSTPTGLHGRQDHGSGGDDRAL
jgi:hypothetical protein